MYPLSSSRSILQMANPASLAPLRSGVGGKYQLHTYKCVPGSVLNWHRHTPIRESSNIQAGVTVDLSELKQIEVVEDKSHVKIGPGNRWQDVYSKLEASSLATSGGRVATVGVGGLVTGGGISFFSQERGLVCDNVLTFEVVLADGRIVEASKDSNLDLYRALKGGSGNLGIVTRIDMATFPFTQMWGGTLFHLTTASARKKLFAYFTTFTSRKTDVTAAWIHSHTYVNIPILGGQWVATSNVHYTLPVKNPPVFKPILGLNVTILQQTKLSTLTVQTQDLAALNPSGSRQLFATMSYKNSAEYMEEFYQLGEQTTSTLKDVSGLKFSLSYQPLTNAMYSKSLLKGGNALGLQGQEADLVIVLLTATWDKAEHDTEVHDAAKDFFTKARARAAEMKVDNSFIYLNYAEKWQDPIKGYGQDNVDLLQSSSTKYDPTALFETAVPGGFKIPK
jgi:hypothetical protein